MYRKPYVEIDMNRHYATFINKISNNTPMNISKITPVQILFT